LTIKSKKFPESLKNLEKPPCVLYISGEIPDFNNKKFISIVGTRSATPYGLNVCFKLSYQLAKKGIIIVSGGALGIDSMAHKGALRAGGQTICVLGCGINYRYLLENSAMRREIYKNGALISEYPPDYAGIKRNFPMRNRLIAGLSSGTVIVEAGEKSGSLITANFALEQGKDVFAVPGDVRSCVSRGTNLLIQYGAKPVLEAQDILEEYNFSNINNINSRNKEELNDFLDNKKEEISYNISDDSKSILDILNKNEKSLDDICLEVNLPVRRVLRAVTELEIHGLIKSLSGKRYCKTSIK